MNLFGSKTAEAKPGLGSSLQQQQEQQLRQISNEFGIKFTKMGIDKQFSEASEGRKNSATVAQSGMTTANSSAFGTLRKPLAPSFETCLGLSIFNSSNQDSDEQHSQLLSPTEHKNLGAVEEAERKRDRKRGYKQIDYMDVLQKVMD